MIPMLYEWLEAGKTAEEIRKNPTLKAIVDEPGMFEGEYFQGKAFGRSTHFFYTMSKQNLAEAWSKTTCKVLAMYGEFDVQALNARDAVTIAETVNQCKTPRYFQPNLFCDRDLFLFLFSQKRPFSIRIFHIIIFNIRFSQVF